MTTAPERLQAIIDATVINTYAAIPDDTTIADAITMDWSPQRNLTLRKALGIPLESAEVCMVNRGDVVHLLTATRKRARYLRSRMQAGLPDGWDTTTTRCPDGWLTTSARTDSTTPSSTAD